jgi:hypothetical protein
MGLPLPDLYFAVVGFTILPRAADKETFMQLMSKSIDAYHKQDKKSLQWNSGSSRGLAFEQRPDAQG